MDMPSFYMRNMLHQYGKQLVTSRRLARYHQLLHTGIEAEMTPEVRRQMMVERVARELFEHLLFTGSENPMVDDVRKELALIVGENLEFRYPPGQLDLSITRQLPTGQEELRPDEKTRVLTQVWKCILARVDATML
jgi:hypothetical protein